MRFGIMSTQMDLLVPPELSAGDLVTHLAGYQHAELIRQIEKRGFNLIEIGGDLAMILPQLFTPEAIEGLVNLKSEIGVEYTVHLPLWSIEPSTPMTPVRKGSVEAVIDNLQLLAPLEPEIYVLHATGALAAEFYQMDIPNLVKGYLLNQFQEGARESVQTILAETGIPSRKLAIETIEFPFEMTLALAEELNLSICFDTGHVLVGFSGPVDFFEALELCLSRLGEIHLHDGPWQGLERNIAYGKDHKALGAGDLDTARLLNRLEAVGFDGPIIFELTVEEAQQSMAVIQSI